MIKKQITKWNEFFHALRTDTQTLTEKHSSKHEQEKTSNGELLAQISIGNNLAFRPMEVNLDRLPLDDSSAAPVTSVSPSHKATSRSLAGGVRRSEQGLDRNRAKMPQVVAGGGTTPCSCPCRSGSRRRPGTSAKPHLVAPNRNHEAFTKSESGRPPNPSSEWS